MVFSGTVNSDFLKLVNLPEEKRSSLINYSAQDFDGLKEALISYIKAVYPLDYNNFAESDLGMMLVELVAYMGAVASFKADLLANENYIRTARNRNNIKKLLELIGVRMKGPISAAANAKITLDSAPWSVSSDYVMISPDQRIKQISSPEDGEPLVYTLYKISGGGLVDLDNVDGNILLYESEASDYDEDLPLTANVFENLVILEGSLIREQGTFVSPDTIKQIRLSKSPVVEGSVQVFITGRNSTSGAYEPVDNIFFASGANSKIFQIIANDNYEATVLFGDGIAGVSPSVGDAYTILYRIGGGSRGNIKRESLNVPITVKKNGTTTYEGVLENTSQATGGSNAETVEHAKKYAPLTFRRQDRLVTIDDFNVFANTFITNYGSTGKATAATRRAYGSANIIDIFVLEKASDLQLRKATPTFKKQLLDAISVKKMLTDEVVIVDGLIRTMDLVITIHIERKYQGIEDLIKTKASNAVTAFFNVDNNEFGKSLISSDIVNSLFDIDEIRFATVDNFPQTVKIDFHEILQLNNLTVNCVVV